MKKLSKEYIIHASTEHVWNALVTEHEIEKWGAGPVIMNEALGKKFSLWGGVIFGTNLFVERNKKLTQEWYGDKTWEKPSLVSIALENIHGGTKIFLNQEKIPDNDFESIDDGWDRYYFGPLRQYLENK